MMAIHKPFLSWYWNPWFRAWSNARLYES